MKPFQGPIKAMETPWGPGTNDLAHDQTQIEGGRMNAHPLVDIGTSSQMDPPHAAGFQHVGETPFVDLGSSALQGFATRSANAATVGVDGRLRGVVPAPLSPPTIRLRQVRANASCR